MNGSKSLSKTSERRKAKQIYGKLFDELSTLLFRHDPAGVNFEVNEDEYQYEAAKILARLETCKTVEDARRVIHEEFVASFDLSTAGPEERYSKIATEIWNLWQSRSQ